MSLVLIADDEEPTLEILANVVEGLGHRVLQARDGDEALMLARTHQPDLLVTDFMMPRRTGVELMRALRDEPTLSGTPVLLISAAQPRAAKEATIFLAKPLDLSEFEREVARLLSGRVGSPRPETSSQPVQQGALKAGARPEMLNWVAHELKSPLSAARMSAELLRRRLDTIGEEQDRKRVQTLLRGIDRMTALVNSVLDAAALGEGRLALKSQPGDLRDFVERALGLWRDLHPEAEFVYTAPTEPIVVSYDELRLQQIVDNLLSNAVKYGGEHKRVTVKLAQQAGRIIFSVQDSGQGIAAAELPHLFERFHRASDAHGEGHGLGLFIAAALARLHGGALSVKSELGQGSTFSLSLPRGH